MLRKGFLILAMLFSVLFFCSSESFISGAKAEPAKVSEKTIQKEEFAQRTLKHEPLQMLAYEPEEASGLLDSSTIGDIVKTFWENDIYITLGSGPCLEDDSEFGNDYFPQYVVEGSQGCKRLIDLTLRTITKYQYLLLIVEGDAKPDAYPSVWAYTVGSGSIGDEYSMIALRLPEEDCVGKPICPLTDNMGGFPSNSINRAFVLNYISDLLSLKSMGYLEDQFIGAIAANEAMVNVLIEEGYLFP